jgi:hypothetical protein
MKDARTNFKLCVLLGCAVGAVAGCESTESGDTQVSAGVYYGAGLYDPWYYGGTYYPPGVVVPPPGCEVEPPHVEHPIATPPPVSAAPAPRPMPSVPAMPRPVMRR